MSGRFKENYLSGPDVEMNRTLLAQLRARVQYELRPKFPALRHFVEMKYPIEWWLAHLPNDTVFVQIGSNDGAQGDPLHDLIIERGWRGVLVEPIPFLFERLKENYASQHQLTFINAAVSSVRESKELYYVAPESTEILDLPYWHDQLGSFQRSHITQHLGEKILPFIQSRTVDCILLEDVVAQANLEKFDLLHIDVEGHDYEILRQLDFDRNTPKMLLFEMKHLNIGDRAAAIESLVRQDYYLFFGPADSLAVRKDVHCAIRAAEA